MKKNRLLSILLFKINLLLKMEGEGLYIIIRVFSKKGNNLLNKFVLKYETDNAYDKPYLFVQCKLPKYVENSFLNITAGTHNKYNQILLEYQFNDNEKRCVGFSNTCYRNRNEFELFRYNIINCIVENNKISYNFKFEEHSEELLTVYGTNRNYI